MIGAGPAGSTCAYRLAAAGVQTLLVDKASFPREKPCGGGLTGRALRQLPFSVDPAIEHVADRMELRLNYRTRFERSASEPLLLLTQRLRLDLLLAERAARAGADFRDGVRVDAVEAGPDRVTARVGGERVEAAALVDAAGANGAAVRGIGLRGNLCHGVALEGNVPYESLASDRYRGRVVIEVGAVPTGYGWIFPKGDHVNVGVGGWAAAGPGLRARLAELCARHGIAPASLAGVRGGRLPVRLPGARAASGRVLAVGDAAGLVDPFSGEGIFEALLSARLASAAISDLLAGRAGSLAPYDDALSAALAPISAASWAAKRAIDRYPRLTFALGRFPPAWGGVVRLLQGAVDHPDAERSSLARIPLRTIQALGQGEEGSRSRLWWRASEPAIEPAGR